jgi:hypothetical protein
VKIEYQLNVHDPREVAAFQRFLSTVAESAEERMASAGVLVYQPVEKTVALQAAAEEPPKRPRKKKDEPAPAVFAGDEEPARIPVYQPDGTVFSSVKTEQGVAEVLGRLLGQCNDLDDLAALWDANLNLIDGLSDEELKTNVRAAFADAQRAAYAPKPAPVPSVDDIRAALRDMAASVDDGMVLGAKILGEFGAEAVSALREDQRTAFLAVVKQHTKSGA